MMPIGIVASPLVGVHTEQHLQIPSLVLLDYGSLPKALKSIKVFF